MNVVERICKSAYQNETNGRRFMLRTQMIAEIEKCVWYLCWIKLIQLPSVPILVRGWLFFSCRESITFTRGTIIFVKDSWRHNANTIVTHSHDLYWLSQLLSSRSFIKQINIFPIIFQAHWMNWKLKAKELRKKEHWKFKLYELMLKHADENRKKKPSYRIILVNCDQCFVAWDSFIHLPVQLIECELVSAYAYNDKLAHWILEKCLCMHAAERMGERASERASEWVLEIRVSTKRKQKNILKKKLYWVVIERENESSFESALHFESLYILPTMTQYSTCMST